MMMTLQTHKLTWRQALARISASVVVGVAIAAAIASHGSASAARLDPAPPSGSAGARLDVLRTGPIESNAPSGVSAGLDGASADDSAIRLLGRNAGGVSLYAATRTNGGACSALSNAKGAVGTSCIENLPPEGITVGASDADGWLLYGFAADDVVGVDVVVDGKSQPATLLENAYVADLGINDLADASVLVVHHADGTASTVQNTLRAPGS